MVTYTFTNGTASDADEVNTNFQDVTVKYYSDNTGSSHTGDLLETDLATITISSGDLGSSGNIVINASVGVNYSSASPSGDTTFKLYIGGVAVKTYTLLGAFNDNWRPVCYHASGVDTSGGSVVVKITGKAGDSSGDTVYCDELVVTGTKV